MAAALLLLPTTQEASAHASDRGYVLLLPTGHYIVGGADRRRRKLPGTCPAAAALARPSRRHAAAACFAWMSARGRLSAFLPFWFSVVLIAAGFFGSRDPLSNPLPLVVWTLLWVGLTLVQGILGNLWAWINPWYGPYWIARRLGLPSRLLQLSERVGYWPAVIQFAGFAWFELIDPAPDDPARLAVVALVYAALNLAATLIFGYRDWSRRGEFLSVFFGMIASFAILQRCREEPEVSLRAAARRKTRRGQAASAERRRVPAACAVVGIVRRPVAHLLLARPERRQPARISRPLGDDRHQHGRAVRRPSSHWPQSFCLAVAAGERLTAAQRPLSEAAGLYVWSIVPIALAYHFAHYLTALLVNGQYAMVALSDPFDLGWNLFGTAYMTVSAGIASGSAAAWVLWNAQAAAIIGGHVLAVLVAHMLADRLHADGRQASLGQLPLTDTDDRLHRARPLAALHADRRMRRPACRTEQLLPAPGIGDLVCIQAIFPPSGRCGRR